MKRNSFKNCLFNNKNCIIKIFVICVMIAVCVISSTTIKSQVLASAEYSTSAKAMVVIEANSKRVLYDKNIHEKLAMASTTKIVTALTVLENCKDINKEIEINPNAFKFM